MSTTLRIDNAISLLGELPLFADLHAEQLQFLAVSCTLRHADKGYMVCDKGAQLEGFYVVRQGSVKLALLAADGAERVAQIVQQGDSFGEATTFIGAPFPLYAQALADTELLFLRQQRIHQALARWPTLMQRFLHRVCEQVHALYLDLEACCLQSARQRVANYLLDGLERESVAPTAATEMTLPAGKLVVASRLNLTPETFSRELRHLASNGVIRVQRSQVSVVDRHRLAAAAGRI